MSRTVTVLLVDASGALLGALPPVEVSTPWWQGVGEISAAVGAQVQVLRLLHGDRAAPPGGHVTYLAELISPVQNLFSSITAANVDLSPHPCRPAYAEVGGPTASIEWAVAALTELELLGTFCAAPDLPAVAATALSRRRANRDGLTVAAPGRRGVAVLQQRTWNLSAIWRVDVDDAPVAWLKQVPSFFAHEAAVLELVGRIAPRLVPPLLAVGESGRMLLGHVPGDDCYGAGADICAAIATAWHPVQAHFADRTEELLAVGVPQWGLEVDRFARVAEPYFETIAGLAELIHGLPSRFAEVMRCGLPDTLLHGDLHPGNARTDDNGQLSILDFGDSAISHPAFDILRLTGGLPDPAPVLAQWAHRWRESVSGCNPMRAVALLRPVAMPLNVS